jgi:hypothetical protein
MLTFIGWWLESKNYTNREQVPRTEEPEKVIGATQIRFDYINKKQESTVNIEMRKHTQLIEVGTRVNIKPKDMVYTDKWLKVDYVETYIPESKKSIVRMWPHRKIEVERKRVYLI